jgi:hypothetical protein
MSAPYREQPSATSCATQPDASSPDEGGSHNGIDQRRQRCIRRGQPGANPGRFGPHVLGTTLGPRVVRDAERPARLCTPCTPANRPRTAGDLRKRVTAIYWRQVVPSSIEPSTSSRMSKRLNFNEFVSRRTTLAIGKNRHRPRPRSHHRRCQVKRSIGTGAKIHEAKVLTKRTRHIVAVGGSDAGISVAPPTNTIT